MINGRRYAKRKIIAKIKKKKKIRFNKENYNTTLTLLYMYNHIGTIYRHDRESRELTIAAGRRRVIYHYYNIKPIYIYVYMRIAIPTGRSLLVLWTFNRSVRYYVLIYHEKKYFTRNNYYNNNIIPCCGSFRYIVLVRRKLI